MMKHSVRWIKCAVSLGVVGLLGLSLSGCVGGVSNAPAPTPVYILTVGSIAYLHEQVTVSPADNAHVTTGTSGLTLSYNPGTTVTLTAPATDNNSNAFLGWCDASSKYTAPFKCIPPPCTTVSGLTCTVTMNSNISVLATYPGILGITLTPTVTTDVFPATVQFTAVVNGLGTYLDSNGNPQPYQGSPYIYTLAGPANYLSPLGTISATGLYTPPFPVPPTVTVNVTPTLAPGIVGDAATITLSVPAVGAGPALTVDAGSPTHAISPYIYGMNDYQLDSRVPALVKLPIERWGGDATTRYNYLVDATNSAYDYYFENNFPSNSNYPAVSQFNSQVTADQTTQTKTIVTTPLVGYTTQRKSACSYSVAKYGAQTVTDPYNSDCGTGILSSNNAQVKNDPTDTSTAIDKTFVGNWAKFLVGKFGTAANGGVAIYALDNEPEYWNGVHKDVHPNPFTYDELSNNGVAYAAAIKAQDPTALVTGPVISNWIQYFYSASDVSSGYNTSPYCQQANPVDRKAHGDVPLIEYYLQQFQKYQTANGTRLLDYVDLHTYFAAPGAAFALSGNLALQQARLDSTRVFWDPTYTDPNYTDPADNATTNACKGAPYPPNLINTMKGWVARNYVGTKLAITEYNWGGQESINGALAQADILGIFGREGLDLATLWGPPDPVKQLPGLLAFAVYTNYDSKGAHFGETAVTSTSASQGLLSVYGATRAADNMLTVVVINKGFIDLKTSLSLPNLSTKSNASVYSYSATNVNAISPQAALPVTAASGTTPASITTTFPAQSITLLVIPRT